MLTGISCATLLLHVSPPEACANSRNVVSPIFRPGTYGYMLRLILKEMWVIFCASFLYTQRIFEKNQQHNTH